MQKQIHTVSVCMCASVWLSSMCVLVCEPKNIPVKIKAKASWLTSSFLAANEKCCRHNLQHFLLFKFSSCPRGLNSRGGVGEIAHLALAGQQEEGGQGVHCTHYHARAHVRVHVRTSRTENIHIYLSV